MKYGLSISDQVSHFLFAVGFGFIIGIFYRIIVSIRQAISRKKAAIIIQDILFSVITTVLFFTFLLVYSDGDIRFDLIIGVAIGAGIYFLSVDESIKSIVVPVMNAVKKLIALVFKPFMVIIKFMKRSGSKIKSSAVSLKGKAKLNKIDSKDNSEQKKSDIKKKRFAGMKKKTDKLNATKKKKSKKV